MINPYQFPNPVSTDGLFFGRDSTIKRLRTSFKSSRSVQLIGQYRIGKSSVLQYVYEHVNKIIDRDKVIPIYYDLSRMPRLRNGQDYFARIWRMISQSLVDRGESRAALSEDVDLYDPEKFEDYLATWSKEEKYQFVVLLDEFGVVARNEDFDLDFFGNLRNTIVVDNIYYIIASPRPLSEIGHSKINESPLFNILETNILKVFQTKEEIHSLIQEPIKTNGDPWPDKVVDFIYRFGGQHPCYIQMMSSILYDTLKDQSSLSPDFRTAEQIFRETADEHFKYLWLSGLVDSHRPALKLELQNALLDLIKGSSIDEIYAEELEERALVWKNSQTESWEVFSAFFGDWLRRWTTQKRNKLESEGQVATKSPRSLIIKSGMVIDEKYMILKVVNQADHSIVALAWDTGMERFVAIKFLVSNRGVEDTLRLQENLKREATILAELDHENIGKVFSIISDPLGIVMEWVEGQSLRRLIDDGGVNAFSESDIILLVAELVDVLDYIHRRNIYHRDLKPENIILKVSPYKGLKLVLIDFDIARAQNRPTISLLEDGTHFFVGTPEYCAPEQFLNPQGVGASTDIFATGILFYELLTGKKPFANGNIPSMYEGGKFPKLSKHNISTPLYNLLCKVLVEDPDKRIKTNDLREELQNYKKLILRQKGLVETNNLDKN